jgi:hypothetical protein
MAKMAILLLCAGLMACGSAADEPGPGALSVEDAKALDEGAAKLDTDPATGPEENKSE